MRSFSASNRRLTDVDGKTIFFVIGVIKSGTTWLQNLLNGHPEICCKGESHLAHSLLPKLSELLAQHNRLITQKNVMLEQTQDGYPTYTREHAMHLMRTALYLLLDAQSNGHAVKCIGEKTPNHIYHLDQLAQLVPDARFVHIIRDGRDGAVSGWNHVYRGSPGWAKSHFPTFRSYAEAFAGSWVNEITLARRFAQNDPSRYFELRYETLHAEPVVTVERLLDFLGADTSPACVERCIAAGRFDRFSGGRARGQEDARSHYRKGITGDWKSTFDEASEAAFMSIAGHLLRELNYL